MVTCGSRMETTDRSSAHPCNAVQGDWLAVRNKNRVILSDSLFQRCDRDFRCTLCTVCVFLLWPCGFPVVCSYIREEMLVGYVAAEKCPLQDTKSEYFERHQRKRERENKLWQGKRVRVQWYSSQELKWNPMDKMASFCIVIHLQFNILAVCLKT